MTDPVAVEEVEVKGPPPAPVPNPNYDGKQNVLRRPSTRGRSGAEKTVPKPKSPTPPMPKAGVIRDALTPVYAMVAMGVGMRNKAIGEAIMTNAEACAESWETLAQTNESVRRVLLTLTKGTAWGVVFAAHLPIVMAVAAEMQPKTITPEEDVNADG